MRRTKPVLKSNRTLANWLLTWTNGPPPNIVTGEDDYDVPLPVFIQKGGKTLQIYSSEQVDLEGETTL